MNDHLSGNDLSIRFTASACRKVLSIYVFSYFPLGFEGRMWDRIVSVPDHCLSFYFKENHQPNHGGPSKRQIIKHQPTCKSPTKRPPPSPRPEPPSCNQRAKHIRQTLPGQQPDTQSAALYMMYPILLQQSRSSRNRLAKPDLPTTPSTPQTKSPQNHGPDIPTPQKSSQANVTPLHQPTASATKP